MNPYSDLFIRLRQAKARLDEHVAYRAKMQRPSKWRPIPLSLVAMAISFIAIGLLCLLVPIQAVTQIIAGAASVGVGGVFLILAAIV
jgi:hypothetical protein